MHNILRNLSLCLYSLTSQMAMSSQYPKLLANVVFNDLSRLGFLYYIFLIIFYGDLSRSKKVTKIISKNIKISSKEKINVQCDGEKYGNLPIEINFSSEVVNLLTA